MKPYSARIPEIIGFLAGLVAIVGGLLLVGGIGGLDRQSSDPLAISE